MGTTRKGALGLLLMVVGVALFLFGMWELAKTGSCGGGTYGGTRPCPSSTPLYVGGILTGALASVVGGCLFATRGRNATDPGLPPPKDEITANPKPFGSFNPHN
jgi:hypothetical protein